MTLISKRLKSSSTCRRHASPSRKRAFLLFLVSIALFNAALVYGVPIASASQSSKANAPMTEFRSAGPELRVTLLINEGIVGYFSAHAKLRCSDGSEHWQLISEGGVRIEINRSGRFSYRRFDPAERSRTTLISTTEIEGTPSPAPALFEAMNGSVYPNSVVGRFRAWEGPVREGKGPHSRCGTRGPHGQYVKFVAHRTRGPALH
jgi:hypothetical protein